MSREIYVQCGFRTGYHYVKVNVEKKNKSPMPVVLNRVVIFADNTSIFYSHSSPNTLESALNNEIKNIEFWLRCNNLTVTVKKNDLPHYHTLAEEM